MKRGSDLFDRKDYRFVFESGIEGSQNRLGPFASFRRLFGTVVISCYALGVVLEAYALYYALGDEFVGYFIWTAPGLVSNVLVILSLPYIGNAVIEMANAVSPFTTGVDMQLLISRFFRSRRQVLFAVFVAAGAALFQIKFLIVSPWREWLYWYAVCPSVTVAQAFMTVLRTGLGYFLISMLFYVCVASGYLVYKIGLSLRQDLGAKEAESSRMQSLGRFGLVVATLWMAIVGIGLLQALVAPIVWWSTLQVFAFAASCIALFVLPITSAYRSLGRIKNRALDDIRAKIWAKYQQVTDSSSSDEVSLALAQIKALRMSESRIVRLHTWPLPGKTIVRFTFTFLASNLPLIRMVAETLGNVRVS
jgi:hypothetical protein